MLLFCKLRLVDVLSNIEESLKISESIIRHEFGVLGDHPALASGDNTSVINQWLSGLGLAGRLLALVVTLIVDH